MAGLNKILLIGGLTKDIDVKYTTSGTAIATVTLATSEKWTDKNNGEKKEESQYHRVVFWGKDAENIGRYCSKGSQLYVDGKLKHRSYEQDGQTKYISEVHVMSFQFLSGKKQAGQQQQNNFQAPQQQNNSGFQTPQQQPSGGFAPQGSSNGNQNFNNAHGFNGPPGDDIPF